MKTTTNFVRTSHVTCVFKVMLCFVLSTITYESLRGQNRVKYNRGIAGYEMGLGICNLLGDLGGANKVGSQGLSDFDKEAIRFTSELSAVFSLKERVHLKAGVQYAHLHGSDSYTLEYSRRKRNITVNTHVLSICPRIEYNLFSKRSNDNMIYSVQVGAGILLFQPYSIYNGKKYQLQPLGTEGQNKFGEKKPYSRIVLNVPYGFSLGKRISSKYSWYLDINGNYAFTDYLDDVSGKYGNNELIKNNNGEVAAFLADPNITGNERLEGTQRGNPHNKDMFISLSIRFRYSIINRDLF